MKILYIFQICEIWKICPLFEIIDRLIDWCLMSSEQLFSYIQDDFWNKVAKYFNGPSMINNPQNRRIGKNTLKLNEKKCHLFVSKTVSYKNLFNKFKSNTDQQSWTFGKNALKLNEKIINSTFLCQKREVTRICLKILKSKTDHDQQSKHFIYSAILTHGHAGKLPGGPMLIYVCCVQHVFVLCLNTDLVESTNTIIVCLILSTFTVLFLWVVV